LQPINTVRYESVIDAGLITEEEDEDDDVPGGGGGA